MLETIWENEDSDLQEKFSDPLNPDRSLQLNNRYWPQAKFEYLEAIREAESLLLEGRWVSMARVLRKIPTDLFEEKNFSKILKKIEKLYALRSTYCGLP